MLQKQHILLKKNPGYVITSDFIVFDSNLEQPQYRSFANDRTGFREILLASATNHDNIFGGPSNFMFETKLAQNQNKVWDESCKYISDLVLLLKVVPEKGGVLNINDPAYLYRRHPKADTYQSCASKESNRSEWQSLCQRIKSQPGNTELELKMKIRYFKFRVQRKLKPICIANQIRSSGVC